MVKLEFSNISLFRADKISNPAKTEAEQRQNQKTLLARVAKIRGYEIAFKIKYADFLNLSFDGTPLTIKDFVTMLGIGTPRVIESRKFPQMNEVFDLLKLEENSTLREARAKIWNLLEQTSEQIRGTNLPEFENPESWVQVVEEVASISITFRYMFRFLDLPTKGNKQKKYFNLEEFLERLYRANEAKKTLVKKNQRNNKNERSKKH